MFWHNNNIDYQVYDGNEKIDMVTWSDGCVITLWWEIVHHYIKYKQFHGLFLQERFLS